MMFFQVYRSIAIARRTNCNVRTPAQISAGLDGKWCRTRFLQSPSLCDFKATLVAGRPFHLHCKIIKRRLVSVGLDIRIKSSGIAGGSAMLQTGHGSPAPQLHSLGHARRGWFSQTKRSPLQNGQVSTGFEVFCPRISFSCPAPKLHENDEKKLEQKPPLKATAH